MPRSVGTERSAWDLLHESYLREKMAHANIVQLGENLCEITMALKNSQLALGYCEGALVSSWDKLNEECMAHRACRDELRNATTLVHRAVAAATRSSQTADLLAREIVDLRASVGTNQTPATHAASLLVDDTTARTSSETRNPDGLPSTHHKVGGAGTTMETAEDGAEAYGKNIDGLPE